MKTSYLVTVATTDDITEAYEEASGRMAAALTSTFASAERVAAITKGAELASCHTEAEVSMLDGSLIGKAVIDMESESKVAIDKTKMSKFLRDELPWKIKVEKRAFVDLTIDEEA